MPAHPWQGLAVLGVAAAAVLTTAPAIAQPDPAATRVAVAGSQPAWATSDQATGEVDNQASRRIQVALPLRHEDEAARLAQQVSTPGSAQRGRFLTAEQFRDRFAPADETVSAVRDWLTAAGVTVDEVSTNRHFLTAHAPVGVLERTFTTELRTFRHDTGDGAVRDLVAPATPITVPTRLRGSVSAVLGLDDSEQTLRPQHDARPQQTQTHHQTPTGTAESEPAAAREQRCARWWGEQNNTTVPQRYPEGAQSNSLCGYSAPSLRALYGAGTTNSGAGTTVGIVGAYNSPTLLSDINRTAPEIGAPALSGSQYKEVLPQDGFTDQDRCNLDSWYGEQTLDVQAVHTMAPAAGIRYYAARTCVQGIYDTFNTAVEDNAIDVISASWGNPDGEAGLPPAVLRQFNAMALQAAIQGQSVLVSTGDAGDNSGLAGRPTASFPASSPYVTAVGGTTVGLDENNKPTVVTGWENRGNTLVNGQWQIQSDEDGPFAGGGGGGRSARYGAPDWQKNTVPDGIARGQRAVPDIAALADAYTGMLLGRTPHEGEYGLAIYGGTSLAAPLIAGLAADAQQARPEHARAGMLNPALYALQGSDAVTDVRHRAAGIWTPVMHALPGATVPNEPGDYLVDLDGRPQNLATGPGWDPVTGIGTPSTAFIPGLARQ